MAILNSQPPAPKHTRPWSSNPHLPLICLLWGQTTVTQGTIPGPPSPHPHSQASLRPVQSLSLFLSIYSFLLSPWQPLTSASIIFLLKLLSSLLSGLLAPQSNQSDPQFAPLCSSHPFSEQGPRKPDLKVVVSPSTSLPYQVSSEL